MADLIQEQATTYTPGENDLVYNTVVTMGSYSSPQPVVIKQYDSLPIIAAKMRKDGSDYQVPDGAAVNIRLHKRSGTFIYSSVKGISQDRKMAYIQLTSNMTAVYGRTMPCLEIVVNGSVACTGDMVWDIQRNPVQEDDVKDTSEGQYIQEMAAQVHAFEDTYQEALDYMNNATNQSRINNAASNAQAAQQAATDAANSADEAEEEANRAATESAKALGFRSFHGGQVVPGATDGDLDPSRPMSTPTAASVTIKARGDRIAGLTMAGKTTQAGTGDPSPDNIRMIDGIGMYDQMVVLDGSSIALGYDSNNNTGATGLSNQGFPRISNPGDVNSGVSNYSPHVSDLGGPDSTIEGFVFYEFAGVSGINVRINSITDKTANGYNRYLLSHPLIIWYRSVDFYKSKGPFYTVVELPNDPYRAVGFELTQPLFDGDTLQVNVPSGCDQMIVLDGSEEWGDANVATFYLSLPRAQANGDIEYSSRKYLSSLSHPNNNYRFNVLRDKLYVSDAGITEKDAFKQQLADWAAEGRPLTIFYRSANYTPDKDIPVVLETHRFKNVSFTGTEDWMLPSGDAFARLVIPDAKADSTAATKDKCSHYNFGAVGSIAQPYAAAWSGVTAKQLALNGEFENAQAAKDYIASQYAAGTPVQVVYELSSPAVFAHEAQTLVAEPGEDGTFTVVGENNLSVLLKPFQDGGNAARLEGHTWDDIMAAIDQKIASLASTVVEVN